MMYLNKNGINDLPDRILAFRELPPKIYILGANVRDAHPRPPSRGLINADNFSFLNAALQALLSCPAFVDLLHSLSMRDLPEAPYPTLYAFSRFFSFLEKPKTSSRQIPATICVTGNPMIPIMFEPILKKFIGEEGKNIWNWPREVDVETFLSFVMNRLDQELRKFDGLPENVGGMEASWTPSSEKKSKEIIKPKSFPSRLSAIFGGEIKIRKGPTTPATVQYFFVLHLDIYNEGVCTIANALGRISVSGTPDGEPVVGKAGQVIGMAKISTFPKILILHLMRFGYDSQKVKSKEVLFPHDLTLGSALRDSREAKVQEYKLVATILHVVMGKSERYRADCCCENGKWLRFFDANMSSKDADDVLEGAPYVLFYEQAGQVIGMAKISTSPKILILHLM